jgi:dynein assembly factor 5, axonemal
MKETPDNSSESTSSSLPSAIAQSLNKFNQGLKDENKFQRKNALESMKKQLAESFKASTDVTTKFPFEITKTILRSTLNAWNDSVEKCRECSCEIVKIILENLQNWDTDMTSMLLMTLYQRLGGKDVKEQSEEIRLELYKLTQKLIEDKSSQQKTIFEVHFQELVSILCNSFNDMYPEVKKTGCLCARLLAFKLKGSNFHMQSESLVKPLLTNLTHQHSRVRKDIVECLCDVVMYGNNKSVTEIIPHLAQRLFDQAHTVRLAVIKLVGTWLLDLPDRYSFWHRLLPLLLTGFIDENAEIKELTESLWWDIGIKYEKENDEELKDKANFLEKDLGNYPKECKNHFCKF